MDVMGEPERGKQAKANANGGLLSNPAITHIFVQGVYLEMPSQTCYFFPSSDWLTGPRVSSFILSVCPPHPLISSNVKLESVQPPIERKEKEHTNGARERSGRSVTHELFLSTLAWHSDIFIERASYVALRPGPGNSCDWCMPLQVTRPSESLSSQCQC